MVSPGIPEGVAEPAKGENSNHRKDFAHNQGSR
jgi:hypothetical protein